MFCTFTMTRFLGRPENFLLKLFKTSNTNTAFNLSFNSVVYSFVSSSQHKFGLQVVANEVTASTSGTMIQCERFDDGISESCKQTLYNFNLVRLQWRLLALYLILLPVRILIHCGMGRFCFSFLASLSLIRSVLCDDIVCPKSKEKMRTG